MQTSFTPEQLTDPQIATIFPNITNFASRDLGFMTP